ncbi:hypothetical protein PBI_GAIA_8 [Mycobacterium phage Gaia]|uniref:Uncharacterized protein n=1 Tax=Mycobacterium phage Gaia TaxID=1486472 RepID=A0A068F3C1_9CAUD|nr:neck protein [Mycobacterium phage Gaia]AID58828.1 hypothetical protein PBI_GAIA_8 [Mycobacterium phage Gaia]AYQ99950.1 hypothetical protein PBI_NEBKISS_8 [Mycobacterium phage Nebkiss]
MAKRQFTINSKKWSQIVKEVIDTTGVEFMQGVADRCNNHLENGKGYLVSVEGDDPLNKRDYRATVITASKEAMRDNAKHDRLISEFH